MNFTEFRASKAFKGTFDEVVSLSRDLEKSMGSGFNAAEFGKIAKKDSTVSARLRNALESFTADAAGRGLPANMAKAEFLNNFASELAANSRSGTTQMQAFMKELNGVVTPGEAKTTLAAAPRAERVAQPTGVIDGLIRNPEKLAKVGGPSVTTALRDYEAVLEGMVKRINRDGVKDLSQQERVALRAVGAAFEKDSKEAGRGITAAQARENLLDALDFKKGTKTRQEMSELLGKPAMEPKAKAPAPVRQEPTLEPTPAPQKADAVTPDASPQKLPADLASEIRNDISDSMRKLMINVGNTNRLDTMDFFSNLAIRMRDPSQLQLVKTLEETGRARPQSFKGIAEAIRDGHKVTEDDFWSLATFFDKNLDVSSARKAVAQAQMMPGAPVTGGKMGGVLLAGEKLFNKVESWLPEKVKSPSRNIIAEWESPTRQPPSAVGRFANNLLDNRITMGTPLALALAFGGNAYFTNFHSDLSYTGDWAKFRTGLAELGIFGDEDAIKEHKDYNQVVGLIYRRLTTAGKIHEEDRFDTLTQKITGQNLFTNAQSKASDGATTTLDFSSQTNIETLRHIIEKSQSVNAGVAGQFSNDELVAYKLYLSKIVHTTEGENTSWKPTTDGKSLVDAWAQKTAIQMNQDPKLRDALIKEYYGREMDANDPDLLKELHTKRGGTRADAYFNSMSRYLVLSGKVDTLATTTDPKLINEYIGKVETANRDKVLAGLAKAGTDLYTEIGAANAGVATQPQQQNTEVSACVKVPSSAKLAEILDNASTLTDVPLKTIETAFSKSVKDGCVTRDVVENELNKVIPEASQARKAAGWVMKGLSEGPQ